MIVSKKKIVPDSAKKYNVKKFFRKWNKIRITFCGYFFHIEN